jgi:hypothetical protein
MFVRLVGWLVVWTAIFQLFLLNESSIDSMTALTDRLHSAEVQEDEDEGVWKLLRPEDSGDVVNGDR